MSFLFHQLEDAVRSNRFEASVNCYCKKDCFVFQSWGKREVSTARSEAAVYSNSFELLCPPSDQRPHLSTTDQMLPWPTKAYQRLLCLHIRGCCVFQHFGDCCSWTVDMRLLGTRIDHKPLCTTTDQCPLCTTTYCTLRQVRYRYVCTRIEPKFSNTL